MSALSLARRAASSPRTLMLVPARVSRRLASSTSHSEHHHDDHQDVALYTTQEGFSSASWRYTIAFALLAAGFYYYAPAPGEDVSITRWLARYATPSETWENINTRHLLLSKESGDKTLLTADARKPFVRRFRYPQTFDQASPHLNPVGMAVDMSGLVVKGDKD